MHCKVFLLGSFLAFVFTGCASTVWYKSGASQADFYRAKSYCQAISTSATPMDYSYQGPTTTYHSGSIYGSSGTYSRYSGTSTTYGNNMGQAFYNLGQSFQRTSIFEECMYGQGYTKSTQDSSYQQAENSKPYSSNVSYGDANDTIIDLDSWEERPVEKFSVNTNFEISLLAKPTFAAETISTISQDSPLEVVGVTDGWYKIQYEDFFGYVAQKWVSYKDGVPPPINYIHSSAEEDHPQSQIVKNKTSISQVAQTEVSTKIHKIVATKFDVDLLAGPSFQSEVKNNLPKNSLLIILGEIESWYQVTYGSEIGYVAKKWVALP